MTTEQLDTDPFHFEPDATAFSIVNANALVRCAGLAYCDEATVKATAKAWGFDETSTRFLDMEDTQGFVISDDRAVIVAFRGTEGNKNDVLTDANAKLTSGPFGYVHQGFAQGLNAALVKLNRALRRIDDGSRKVWFTGHSLGAALATLVVSSRLELKQDVAGLYTYGSPRCGNWDFANGVNARLDNNQRMVFGGDVVSRVAPRAMQYSHVGRLVSIAHDGTLTEEGLQEVSLGETLAHTLDSLRQIDLQSVKDHMMATGYLPILKQLAENSLSAEQGR